MYNFLIIFFKIIFFCLIFHGFAEKTENDNFKNEVENFENREYDKCTNCVPPILYSAHLKMEPKPKLCKFTDGSHGYCLSSGGINNQTNFIRKARSISERLDHSIIEEAKSRFAAMLEKDVASPGLHLPEYFHHSVFYSSANDILKNIELSNSAMEQILAAQILKDRENIPTKEFEGNTVERDFTATPLSNFCPAKIISCKNIHSKYRSADGTCNNFNHIFWGSKGQPMKRILQPSYEDGIWEPRRHSLVDGSPLEEAREISRILLPDIHRPHPFYNLLLMQYGQFISHDVTQSSSITKSNGDPIQCCSADGKNILPPEESHYACLPIHIQPEDEFYQAFNQGCMNFVRLSLSPHPECRIGYGRQMSKVTHYLDASTVYGSDLSSANNLRTFRNGRLRMFKERGRYWLPLAKNESDCMSLQAGSPCFKAGDGRVSQILSLTLLHTIFAREHNRIANILAELNPHYSDEKLYQESRRIVIAAIQHITYNEYLPLIIGQSAMKRFKLSPKLRGYRGDYNNQVNVAVSNEFTGAAFRFGHSSVDGKFIVHQRNNIDEIDIPDVMFNTKKLTQQNFLDDFIRTLVHQPMQQIDNSITNGLTRNLFRGKNPFGLDLAALNIQRGRDHGLKTYNDYLELIGHRRIKSFSEFNSDVGHRLAAVYRYTDDIDLWIGGILEPHIGDGTVGPTFTEIIAEQFFRLRIGDRYFYENGPELNPGYFTPAQLHEIRKITLARILCDNMDYYTAHLPPKAFIRADLKENYPVYCDSNIIPKINFILWKEQL